MCIGANLREDTHPMEERIEDACDDSQVIAVDSWMVGGAPLCAARTQDSARGDFGEEPFQHDQALFDYECQVLANLLDRVGDGPRMGLQRSHCQMFDDEDTPGCMVRLADEA
jgi:hypothetical protein